LIPG
jgi:hypothetical protein